MLDADRDREHARWQDRIEDEIRRAGIEPLDASGSESGDPLDWTADQVRHALGEANALRVALAVLLNLFDPPSETYQRHRLENENGFWAARNAAIAAGRQLVPRPPVCRMCKGAGVDGHGAKCSHCRGEGHDMMVTTRPERRTRR